MKKKLLILLAVISFGISNVYAQKSVTCPSCNGSCKTTERCGNCHNGAILCNSCSGSGEKKERCHGCNHGYIERTVRKICSNCNGNRYFTQNQPKDCSCRNGKVAKTTRGGVVIYVACSRCNGRGILDNHVNVACRSCGATGYFGTETIRERHNCDYGYISNKCYTCNGRGSYMCSKCQGYANIQVGCRRCKGAGRIYVYVD